MKKVFENPSIAIIRFEPQDVITTSNFTIDLPDDDLWDPNDNIYMPEDHLS